MAGKFIMCFILSLLVAYVTTQVCADTSGEFTGKYYSTSDSVVNSILTINPDSTFEYRIYEFADPYEYYDEFKDHSCITIFGSWKRENDFLLLKSTKQPSTESTCRIRETIESETNTITFEVQGKDVLLKQDGTNGQFIIPFQRLLPRKDISGKYYYGLDPFTGSGVIHLKADGSFVFDYSVHLLNAKATGKWRIEDGFLVLNSDKQPDDEEFKYQPHVEEKEVPGSASVTIKVVDDTHLPLPGAKCSISAQQKVLSDFSDDAGICSFEGVTAISSLMIELSGYRTIEYVPHSGKSNAFEVTLEIEWQNDQFFFTNDKWKIGDEKMILIDPACGDEQSRECIWRLLIE